MLLSFCYKAGVFFPIRVQIRIRRRQSSGTDRDRGIVAKVFHEYAEIKDNRQWVTIGRRKTDLTALRAAAP